MERRKRSKSWNQFLSVSTRVEEDWDQYLSGQLEMEGGIKTAVTVMAMQLVHTPSLLGQSVRMISFLGMPRCAPPLYHLPTAVDLVPRNRS